MWCTEAHRRQAHSLVQEPRAPLQPAAKTSAHIRLGRRLGHVQATQAAFKGATCVASMATKSKGRGRPANCCQRPHAAGCHCASHQLIAWPRITRLWHTSAFPLLRGSFSKPEGQSNNHNSAMPVSMARLTGPFRIAPAVNEQIKSKKPLYRVS